MKSLTYINEMNCSRSSNVSSGFGSFFGAGFFNSWISLFISSVVGFEFRLIFDFDPTAPEDREREIPRVLISPDFGWMLSSSFAAWKIQFELDLEWHTGFDFGVSLIPFLTTSVDLDLCLPIESLGLSLGVFAPESRFFDDDFDALGVSLTSLDGN